MSEPIKPLVRHEKLAEVLRSEIRVLEAGTRLESISSLAKRFSVSEITARQALLSLAKDGLVEIKHGSGTFVCPREDKRPVGVWLGLDISIPDISYFWRRVAQQVKRGLRARGCKTRFYAGDYRHGVDDADKPCCNELVDDVTNGQLRGLVSISGPSSPEIIEPLRRQNAPCVGWSSFFDASVQFDRAQTIREAARRLLQAGRRKVAFMGWSPATDQWSSRDEMLDVIVPELDRKKVRMNQSWIRSDIHPTLPGAGWSDLREIWTASADKPDALIVNDDMLLRSAATAIQELGIRVPEQLMVVTHANKGDDYHYPFPVWRMEADPDAFAQAQVDLMVALLRRETVADPHVVLPLELIAPEEAAIRQPGRENSITGQK